MNSVDSTYAGVRASKTGLPVPVFADGCAAHSLYDPVREGSQLARTCPDDAFIVFAGIGGGYHIREYLAAHPGAACAVAESGIENFAFLRSLVDISDIIERPGVTVIPDCADESAVDTLVGAYVPALHGDFRVVALRSWQDRNATAFRAFGESVDRALNAISADYSVQAHFGKLWFRNSILNLAACSEGFPEPRIPRADGKKAIIAAAGPSLEDALPALRAERDSFAIFSTDTAYGTLCDSGIVPDFFVSVDAQAVSARHVMSPLSPKTTVIMDLCGNPDIPAEARRRGSPIIFAAGAHPFARLAARAYPFPALDASSGTVTLAARQAALALGYAEAGLVGADFAYVGGKPYARGTYLDATFSVAAGRLSPAETLYAALMFRTAVRTEERDGRVTYYTDVLDRYALAARKTALAERWHTLPSGAFPFADFMASYRLGLERSLESGSCPDDILKTILPLMAWGRKRKPADGIKLALDLIARYTAVS